MHQNKNQNKKQNIIHEPVLLQEVLKILNPHTTESYLDVTAGYGGHAAAILNTTQNYKESVLVDRDQHAIDYLKTRFDGLGLTILHGDFLSTSQALLQEKTYFDLILADIGVSSPHLNDATRGFGILVDSPLDMRMDQRQTVTAATILNEFSVDQLTEILQTFGEEPKAKQIALDIVRSRPLTSTGQLAAIAAKAWPGYSRSHPATRTFQAIRIAVNSELVQLEQALPLWIALLKPGGRLAVISFHSLEDRLVKRSFQSFAGGGYDATLTILTKRPITASREELVFNPRARSAKLRAAAKNKKGKGMHHANSGS